MSLPGDAKDVRFVEVERDFNRDEEAGNYPHSAWAHIIPRLRRHAAESGLAPEQYRSFLFETAMVLRHIAHATGHLREESRTGKIFAVHDIWRHATFRNLVGVDPTQLDLHRLVDAFRSYRIQPAMATPYLDWVFLDAYLYHVIFNCKWDVDEDRLGPWDTGTWIPRFESIIAHSKEAETAHSFLLDIKASLLRWAMKALPTAVGLLAGITLLYLDCPRTGVTVLGFVFIWRGLRLVRWAGRTPLRRRARRFLAKLESAYGLLAGTVIPVKELRGVVDEALQIWGERLVFGVEFWAVLNYVCDAHPVTLIPREK